MRKLSLLMGSFAILVACALIISCEGPQGPAGTDGADGSDGAPGADGANAAETCTQCHSDDQVIVTKSKQYANSGHNTGHTSGYTNRSFGPSYNCAGCHTSQGFLDNLVGASNTPYADVTQPNCYTCHTIHDTYTEADWALTNGGTPVPMSGSAGVDIGTGNQCTSCHQSTGRYLSVDSLWADFDAGTTTVTIDGSLKRAGVHHGPQYNTLVGLDMFEFTGTETVPTDHHVLGKVENGCVTCHMNDGFGDLTGHSMSMTWEWHGSENYNWPESCNSCHDPEGAIALDAVYASVKAEIDGLLTQLYDLLIIADVIYPEGDSDEFLMKPGVFSTTLTAAHVNYNVVREDRSHGFHNPGYVRAVLTNTIESVTALP